MHPPLVNVEAHIWFSFWLYDSDVLQCAFDFDDDFAYLVMIHLLRPDPNGIIAFMVDALQAAEDAGDRAWIIGHIPPGKEDTLVDQVRVYINLVGSAHCNSSQTTLIRSSNATRIRSRCSSGHSHKVRLSQSLLLV